LYQECESRALVPCPAPLEVKHAFLKHYMERYTPESQIRDSAYYTMGMDSYSSWSYEVHQDQLRDVLKNVPKTMTVVAPADGLGVVAGMWKGPIVSGDYVVTDLTHPSTREEDIHDTVVRGLAVGKEKAVFVFSYCWEWVQESTKALLQGCQLVVLQPVDVLPRLCEGVVWIHAGPGLFVAGVPYTWQLRLRVLEYYRPPDSISFSENLLQEPGFQVLSPSPYLTYYQIMMPRAPISLLGPVQCVHGNIVTDRSLPILATTLSDLFNALVEDTPVYFAPIGRIFEGIVAWGIERSLETKRYHLPSRQVIVVESSSPFAEIVRVQFDYLERDGRCFFYSSHSASLAVHYEPDPSIRIVAGVEFTKSNVNPNVPIVKAVPVVMVKGASMLISDGRRSIRYCACVVRSQSDVCHIIHTWFPEGGVTAHFVTDVLCFSSMPYRERDALDAKAISCLSCETIGRLMGASTLKITEDAGGSCCSEERGLVGCGRYRAVDDTAVKLQWQRVHIPWHLAGVSRFALTTHPLMSVQDVYDGWEHRGET